MLPFLLFAFVSSITPGPTNILVLSNSARYGLRAAVPIVLGACAGAAGLVLVVGTGLGQLLLQMPRVQQAMAWAGVLWLTWLAWGLFRAPAFNPDQAETGPRLGWIGAAGLQLINPKTWMMALAVMGVFSLGAVDPTTRVAQLALMFFLVAVPCMICWALLGVGSARVLRSSRAQRGFNQGMALLLLVAAWSSLLAAS
ncbi:LysE family translocator [Pseudomonas sp. dw_358]|uniref:LysE family translocator n=1 Tax=Pseudomonas sp. dw_358 TaxID=2720083 RepID=UPI001BD4CD75|nr:LysE family translocator [Pseudomonas sp. dw_358]